jgi:hypothetical protein
MPPKRKNNVAVDALAQLWHRGLLDGDASANADVYGALANVTAVDDTWVGTDRVALRQLVTKAQAEVCRVLFAVAWPSLAN